MEYNFKAFTGKGSKGNFISVRKEGISLSNAASSMLSDRVSIYLDKKNYAILLRDETIGGEEGRSIKIYNNISKIHCFLDVPLGRYYFLEKFDGGFVFKLKNNLPREANK